MNTTFFRNKAGWHNTALPLFMAILLAIGGLLAAGMSSSAENHDLAITHPAKAVIDFRTGNPARALVYLTLIADTYNDRQFKAANHSDFVVVFGGESVKLLASDTQAYSAEDRKTIATVRDTVSAMAKAGIRFEYCKYGGRLFGVEPAQVAGMSVVDNGWVSLVSDQASGYSLVAAY